MVPKEIFERLKQEDRENTLQVLERAEPATYVMNAVEPSAAIAWKFESRVEFEEEPWEET